jgi:ribA/ribD-fused uncharacterized protein
MELYTEGAVFMFHSRSADARPGAGVDERSDLPAETFAVLARYPNWRRRLSNFAPSNFTLDGLRWPTVEHCFQASKFVEVAPDYYRLFSLDSASELCRSDGAAAKRAGGRHGRPMSEAERTEWESRKRGVMRRALQAKYTQNDEDRAILIATWPAKLTHKPLRSRHTVVEIDLMEVRRALHPSPSSSTPS